MKSTSHWRWILAGRVAVHAVLGAAFCATVGALLIAVAGASVGAILDSDRLFARVGGMANIGAMIGFVLGGIGGGGVGAIASAVIGFLSAPGRYYFPPRQILVRIFLGMWLATVAVMMSFYVLMAVIAMIRGIAFSTAVGDGLLFIMWGAPAIMLCGQIVGAVNGHRRQKELHRAASSLPNERV